MLEFYQKIERKVGDYAADAVACQLSLEADVKIHQIGIGLTNVGPVPIRSVGAEGNLRGKTPDDRLIQESGRLAAEECNPVDDLRGSAGYKRDLVNELTQRAIKISIERAERG